MTHDYAVREVSTARLLADNDVNYNCETHCLNLSAQERGNMGQFAETHFAEFGSVPTLPFCWIFFRQIWHRNSAKWASKFGKVGKAVVYICKNRLFESENIIWGISDVCTLALTVAKTSSHYDRFAISVPARSLLLFDLA